MLEQLEGIKSTALKQLEGIDNIKDLESWRVHYLGKKSPLTQMLRSLATLPIEE
jgi:phenylalanyl-tRNA synthetase alpha chain